MDRDSEGPTGTRRIQSGWYWLRLLAAATVAASIATAAFAQQKYTITDLGVVPTVNGNASGDTDASAMAINNKGAVVGLSGQFGWAEQDGYLYDITYCTPYTNSAYYNKNEGVCGSFDNKNAFLWTPSSTNVSTGVISYLGGLPGDYCFSPEHTVGGFTTPASFATLDTAASDINSAGQAVGYSWTSPDGLCTSVQIHGALWQNGIAVDLGLPGG